MPYIEQWRRDELDVLRDSGTPGELNYTITQLINSYMPNASYTEINEVIGVLECVKLELYRRIAAPYEDTKKSINGEVYDISL